MKDRVETVFVVLAGIGGLIGLVGIATAFITHHPVALLIGLAGMLLAAPAATLSTVKKLRKSQKKMERARQAVEKKIEEGEKLSAIVPNEIAFTERQRKFWISWWPGVFILGISLAFGLVGGWTVLGSFLAVGFAVWIFLILIGGFRNKDASAGAGIGLADDDGAIYETVRLTESKAKKLLPPSIYSEWRNYHLAREVVRFCLALWVFAAIVSSYFAALDWICGKTTLLEGVRTAAGWIGFAMLVTAPVILLVLVAGAFSRWRIRRWERREESTTK